MFLLRLSPLLMLYFQNSDKSVLKNKHGEFWMEVKNGVVFGVTQYEGFKDQHYVCFHTSSICLYHQGNQLLSLLAGVSMHRMH